MDNVTLLDNSDEIDRLNSVEVSRLIPLLVYLGLIAVTGIPGNIIICLSYRSSSQKSSSRFFIWWLAIVDTISCFVLFLEIVNVVHQFNYPNNWLCKLTIFSTIVPVGSSGFALCLISIDRFKRVCRPLNPQFSVSKAKKMSAVSVGVALFFAWPSLVLYGIHEPKIPGTNVTGRECTIENKYQHATVTMIYQSLLWLVFISCLVFLAVMYILIGKRIFSQMNTFARRTSSRDAPLGSFDDASVEISTHERTSTTLGRQHSAVSMNDVNKKVSTTNSNKSTQRQLQARKSALIMCLISVVFIISFLPYLMLRACEAFNETFLVSMTDTERALYKTFLRSYFLNSAINPFIYCACAATFRQEVRRYFRQVWQKFRYR